MMATSRQNVRRKRSGDGKLPLAEHIRTMDLARLSNADLGKLALEGGDDIVHVGARRAWVRNSPEAISHLRTYNIEELDSLRRLHKASRVGDLIKTALAEKEVELRRRYESEPAAALQWLVRKEPTVFVRRLILEMIKGKEVTEAQQVIATLLTSCENKSVAELSGDLEFMTRVGLGGYFGCILAERKAQERASKRKRVDGWLPWHFNERIAECRKDRETATVAIIQLLIKVSRDERNENAMFARLRIGKSDELLNAMLDRSPDLKVKALIIAALRKEHFSDFKEHLPPEELFLLQLLMAEPRVGLLGLSPEQKRTWMSERQEGNVGT